MGYTQGMFIGYIGFMNKMTNFAEITGINIE